MTQFLRLLKLVFAKSLVKVCFTMTQFLRLLKLKALLDNKVIVLQ